MVGGHTARTVQPDIVGGLKGEAVGDKLAKFVVKGFELCVGGGEGGGGAEDEVGRAIAVELLAEFVAEDGEGGYQAALPVRRDRMSGPWALAEQLGFGVVNSQVDLGPLVDHGRHDIVKFVGGTKM